MEGELAWTAKWEATSGRRKNKVYSFRWIAARSIDLTSTFLACSVCLSAYCLKHENIKQCEKCRYLLDWRSRLNIFDTQANLNNLLHWLNIWSAISNFLVLSPRLLFCSLGYIFWSPSLTIPLIYWQSRCCISETILPFCWASLCWVVGISHQLSRVLTTRSASCTCKSGSK